MFTHFFVLTLISSTSQHVFSLTAEKIAYNNSTAEHQKSKCYLDLKLYPFVKISEFYLMRVCEKKHR
jgi:hypothetical protein